MREHYTTTQPPKISKLKANLLAGGCILGGISTISAITGLFTFIHYAGAVGVLVLLICMMLGLIYYVLYNCFRENL